jgi:hypothetical protein
MLPGRTKKSHATESKMAYINSKIQPTPRNAPRLILYDLHQVSRFLHTVAYTVIAATSLKIVHHNFLEGGDQVDYTRDQGTIRLQADALASSLMNRFSQLCKTGSKRAVDAFLQHQKLNYIACRSSMDTIFAQVRDSNDALQRNLGIAADIAHIVHGTANATFTVLSFVVTPGAGLGLANALNFADSLISGPSVIGAVKDETLNEAASGVADAYAKSAAKSITNIVTRDWKYQGALRNAQTRFVTQAGISAGARTLSIYLAVVSLKGDLAEIRDAAAQLAQPSPAPTMHRVESVPDLQVPLPR